MATRRTVEDELLALEAVRVDPGDDSLTTLRAALAHRSNHVVAKAARIVMTHQTNELGPELAAAFDRFMLNPVKTDPGCAAKAAIVDAFNQLDLDEGDVLLRGVRHVQVEPAYGGAVDTAASTRGASGMGLARVAHPQALVELADLLADPELPARLGAARGLSRIGQAAGSALLRFKLRIGDKEPDVVSECLVGLLSMDDTDGLEVAMQLLDGPSPEMQKAAALALGESSRTDAFAPLRRWVALAVDDAMQRIGFAAIALLRNDDGHDFLLQAIEAGSLTEANAAQEALTTYGRRTGSDDDSATAWTARRTTGLDS